MYDELIIYIQIFVNLCLTFDLLAMHCSVVMTIRCATVSFIFHTECEQKGVLFISVGSIQVTPKEREGKKVSEIETDYLLEQPQKKNLKEGERK